MSAYGRVLVPINFRLNAEEIGYIVEHSGASVLLVDPELEESLAGVTARHRFVIGKRRTTTLCRFDTEPEPWIPDEDTTGTINYTSGTTARPKGVQLTHRTLWINATTFGWQTGVSDRDVYLWTLPMFHCNGWGMSYAITGMGGRHIVLRKVDGAEILRRVERARRDAPLRRARGRGRDPRRRRAVGRSDPRARPGAHGRGRRATADAHDRADGDRARLGVHPDLRAHRDRAAADDGTRTRRMGRALAGRRTRRSSAARGRPRSACVSTSSDQGEVLARSNVVLEGYWEQPEATADALAGGWFHTGDGGTIDDDHYLTISDRKKDVIISGGENVSSIEVEDCLYQHPGVAEACVIGVPDEKWGETVKALVVLEPGSRRDRGRARSAHCREKLTHFKCPTSVEFRAEFARTSTGKLQKFKIRAPYWEGRTRQVN